MTQMTPIGAPARSEVLAFQRWQKCLLAAKDGGAGQARLMYESRYPHSEHFKSFEVATISEAQNKASTAPLLAAGSPLNSYERLANSWLRHVYPRTVLGRLTGQREAPMETEFPKIVGGANGFGWVGENDTIRISNLALENARMERLVVAGICIISEELARHASPVAERLVADDLERAAVAALDRAFLDPAIDAVAGVSPASITNGVAPIVNASTTSTNRSFEDAFANLTSDLISPFVILPPKTALALVIQGGSDRLYPDLRVNGGAIWGAPVLVSSSAPARTATILDAALLLTGRDVPFFDTARHATIEMDDAPDGTNPRVSLWQSNLLGLRMRMAANWQMGQSGGVAVIENLPELGVSA